MKSVLVLLAAAATLLAACDPQRISELQEGVSTETDVRERFGQPEHVWDAPDGARVLEYNRNPAGHENYMITIGPDGRMRTLRQVLTPETFAQIKPGMMMEEVRRMLGKPARQDRYAQTTGAAWSWRYLQSPNTSMLFTVWFDSDWRVARTSSGPDLQAPEHRGGPS